MKIEQKLMLSNQNYAVRFFKEGMFVQVFLKSLYIAVTQLNLAISVKGNHYKKLNNQLILRAGLPVTTLKSQFSNLIETPFGYELQGSWDCSCYQTWYQNQLLLQQAYLETQSESQLLTPNINNEPIAYYIPLTEQQLKFLLNWQEPINAHQPEVCFVKEVKQRLIK